MALEKDEREAGTCSWCMLEIDVKTKKVLRILVFRTTITPLCPAMQRRVHRPVYF